VTCFIPSLLIYLPIHYDGAAVAGCWYMRLSIRTVDLASLPVAMETYRILDDNNRCSNQDLELQA
jgi:hypothetical protein